MCTCLDKSHLIFEVCQHQLSTEHIILSFDKTIKFIRLYLGNLGVVFMLWFFIFQSVSLQGISVCIMGIIIFKIYEYAGKRTFFRHTKGLESTKLKKNPCDKLCMGYVVSLSF